MNRKTKRLFKFIPSVLESEPQAMKDTLVLAIEEAFHPLGYFPDIDTNATVCGVLLDKFLHIRMKLKRKQWGAQDLPEVQEILFSITNPYTFRTTRRSIKVKKNTIDLDDFLAKIEYLLEESKDFENLKAKREQEHTDRYKRYEEAEGLKKLLGFQDITADAADPTKFQITVGGLTAEDVAIIVGIVKKRTK